MPATSKTAAARTQRERVEESAKRLLQAAVELIAEQGFEKTTVAQIGERAGYSHSMVHARYGSKNALLTTLFEAEWQSRLIPTPSPHHNGLERILRQIDQLLEAIRTERDLFRAVIVLSFEIVSSGVAMKPWYREWFERYFDYMAENLVLGEADGSIRPGLDHRAEARRFVTYGSGLCFMWSLDWDNYDMISAVAEWRQRLQAEYAVP